MPKLIMEISTAIIKPRKKPRGGRERGRGRGNSNRKEHKCVKRSLCVTVAATVDSCVTLRQDSVVNGK